MVTTPIVDPCRHCKKRKITRPRRLCHPCHAKPNVRAMYPAGSVTRPTTFGAKIRETKPAARACEADPGSAERVEELRRRVANREELWHERDRRTMADGLGCSGRQGPQVYRSVMV